MKKSINVSVSTKTSEMIRTVLIKYNELNFDSTEYLEKEIKKTGQ